MRRLPYALIIAFVIPILVLAQDSNSQNPATPPEGPRFSAGTTLRVDVDKTVDAKKARPGDPVLARTDEALMSGSKEVAPKGLKVLGHVVAATPHEKDSPSTLEIAFDKLVLNNGSEVPMKAAIQAMGRPVFNTDFAASEPSVGSGYPASSSPMGGRTGNISPGGGSPAPTPGNTGNAGQLPTGAANGPLPTNAQGVVGIPGVTLSPGPSQDSVITDSKHNAKLESGTQLILRVE